MECTLAQWNHYLAGQPDAHVLQSGAWGELKSKFGWHAVRLMEGQTGAQVLLRPLAAGMNIAYLPKGPVGGQIHNIQTQLDQICKKNHAIFLKVEPDAWQGENDDHDPGPGWIKSQPIQPRRTVLVPLEGTEDEILSKMKQKTRYNIRLAEKKGVVIRPDADMHRFFELMRITGSRDSFGVHAREYYQNAYLLFHPTGNCECFTAFYKDLPLASIMVFAMGSIAWYMYGASTDQERNRMPTYLLQWEAMRWAKSKGCRVYDLWGIPDYEVDELEEGFSDHGSHEGLWGVYRFKRGFGGDVVRSVGAWDRVYHPLLYKAYQQLLKLRRGDHE